MIPYASFWYFAWLLYPTVPTLVLGWLGRLSRYWLFGVTVVVILVQYATPTPLWVLGAIVPAFVLVMGYAVYQFALTRLFLFARLQGGKRRGIFLVVVALSLAPLVVVKLAPLGGTEAVIGFLGISYVSFRALDVVIGIQDGLIEDLPLVEYFTFLVFFPAISSGPIDRYRRFGRDWDKTRTREEFVTDLDAGVHKIFMGFLYKFILAYLIKLYWVDSVSHANDILSIVSYMYGYSFYLFFDFAGYSMFAIGFSYLFGIHTPENFHRPFASENVQEFWNRWHMSLSFWFRDHVYARFLMASARGKWFKSRQVTQYLGLALTFGLIGIWHGVAWHYLVYGLYHAGLLIGHDWFGRWNQTHQVWKASRGWRALGIVLTFNLVCFGFLIFSGRLG
ncbi:MAG TPA: D-alanyl-lipoteichoic acid biosynthesis protein DltB [Anaerolineae bacterium]|nr:D-alanyl-lipoteichoic acid biosynthesis protein DltB [Anaerolineae bacterium]